MNDPELFKTLCELWASHFSIMLTCITILAGLFGVGCPLMISFFQRQNIKDERERLSKEMAEKFAEQQNLISQQQNRIESLQNLLSNAYIALAQFYLDGLKTKIIEWHWPGREEPQKNDIMYKILDYFRKAIQCLINSGNRDELLKIMEVFSAKMPTFLKENTELVKKTLLNNPQFFSPSNFFTKDDLSETVGFDNAIYKKFIQRFAFLFDMIDECANNEFRQEEK